MNSLAEPRTAPWLTLGPRTLTSHPASLPAALWAAPQFQTKRGSSCYTCPAAVGTVARALAWASEGAQGAVAVAVAVGVEVPPLRRQCKPLIEQLWWRPLLESRSSCFLFSLIEGALLIAPYSCLLASFFVASETKILGKHNVPARNKRVYTQLYSPSDGRSSA